MSDISSEPNIPARISREFDRLAIEKKPGVPIYSTLAQGLLGLDFGSAEANEYAVISALAISDKNRVKKRQAELDRLLESAIVKGSYTLFEAREKLKLQKRLEEMEKTAEETLRILEKRRQEMNYSGILDRTRMQSIEKTLEKHFQKGKSKHD